MSTEPARIETASEMYEWMHAVAKVVKIYGKLVLVYVNTYNGHAYALSEKDFDNGTGNIWRFISVVRGACKNDDGILVSQSIVEKWIRNLFKHYEG